MSDSENLLPLSSEESRPNTGTNEQAQNLLLGIRSGFALQDYRSDDVHHYEDWYSERPDYLNRMFTRARLYLPYILEEVNRRGMPTEIALLPAIESAFRPDALSTSGASGLWQFIPSTADIFGLRQDEMFDGRQDIILSTIAALDYLEELHGHFQGDWFLALAAYNGGRGYISRAVKANFSKGLQAGFPDLDLRSETRRFVPKLLAIRNIVAHPDLWSLELPVIDEQPYFVSIKSPAGTTLEDIALANNISVQELQALNPALKQWRVPQAGPHRLLVPANHLDQFLTSTGEQKKPDRSTLARPAKASGWRFHRSAEDHSVEVYRVRAGDTLSSISRMFRVSVAGLAEWNKLSTSQSLSPGQYLRILEN